MCNTCGGLILFYGSDHTAFQGRQGCCSLQDVTPSMCGGFDREAEADEKRKENKDREEREALRCAWYPISTQYPSQAWKNTKSSMNGIHDLSNKWESLNIDEPILGSGWELRSNGGWIKAWKQYAVPHVSKSQICGSNLRSFLFLKMCFRCLTQDQKREEEGDKTNSN